MSTDTSYWCQLTNAHQTNLQNRTLICLESIYRELGFHNNHLDMMFTEVSIVCCFILFYGLVANSRITEVYVVNGNILNLITDGQKYATLN